MISEVLIYVPSIARFRQVYLKERIAAAQIASLALKATTDHMVSKELAKELLDSAGLLGVTVKRPDRRSLMLSLSMPTEVDASYDLRDAGATMLIVDAFATLATPGRVVRVADALPGDKSGSYTEVIMDERPMREAMFAYSINILQLSVIISVITAGLVYLALHVLMVRPMQRLIASMTRFRKAPEDERSIMPESQRGDEIGAAEAELGRMQGELRSALQQKAHLAALGAAVSKVSHDLRNILATAQLVSDRLGGSLDPQVQRVAPRLVESIDRAIELCQRTLSFGRADEQPPQRRNFDLAELVDDVAISLGLSGDGADGDIEFVARIATKQPVFADRDQLFRVLLNMLRNAMEALNGPGEIAVEGRHDISGTQIVISDNGPGLPEKALENLFEPFAGSARAGGTGLGLAIARELVRGHGGDITLEKTGPAGTRFRISLPDRSDNGRSSKGNGK